MVYSQLNFQMARETATDSKRFVHWFGMVMAMMAMVSAVVLFVAF